MRGDYEKVNTTIFCNGIYVFCGLCATARAYV